MFLQAEPVPPSSRYKFLQAERSRLRPAFDPAFVPLYVFTSGTVPPSVPPSSRYVFLQAARSRLRPASCFYKRNGPAFVPSSSRYMFLQAGWSRLRPAFVPLYVFTSGTVPLSIPPSPRYVSLPAERSRLPPRLRPAFGPAFVPLSVFTSGAAPPSIAPSSRYMSLPAARSRIRSRLRPAKCFHERNGPALVSWTLLGSLGCPGFSWAVLGSPWLAWSLLGWGSPGLSWALLGSLGPWALLGCLGLSRARGLFGAPLGSLFLLGSPGLSGLSWAFIEIGRYRGYLKDCAINRFGRVSTCSDPAAAARKPQTEF